MKLPMFQNVMTATYDRYINCSLGTSSINSRYLLLYVYIVLVSTVHSTMYYIPGTNRNNISWQVFVL